MIARYASNFNIDEINDAAPGMKKSEVYIFFAKLIVAHFLITIGSTRTPNIVPSNSQPGGGEFGEG